MQYTMFKNQNHIKKIIEVFLQFMYIFIPPPRQLIRSEHTFMSVYYSNVI